VITDNRRGKTRNVMKNPKDKKSHENEAFKREGITRGEDKRK